MGESPPTLTLDRIDNNKGYSKKNCRWADHKTQCRNKRNNLWLELEGERMILEDWAKKLGIHKTTIHSRLRLGWSVRQALS